VDGMTLQKFVEHTRELIGDGSISQSSHAATVQFIMWQLVTTIRWMHEAQQCVHLDLNLSNVMLTADDDRGIFIESDDGSVTVNGNVSIKLLDFGVAERYRVDAERFECHKQSLSLEHHEAQCPNLLRGQSYDAKAHDMWCLGQMLFVLMTGRQLYGPEDLFDFEDPDGALKALCDGKLARYLKSEGLLQCFRARSFAVLEGLLSIEEEDRWTAAKVVEHSWFKSYHAKYGPSLELKMKRDALKLQNEAASMQQIPFYDD